jgi:hypothetical protein
MRRPIAGRGRDQEKKRVEFPRLLEGGHPAGEGRQAIEVEFQRIGAEQFGKVPALVQRGLKF